MYFTALSAAGLGLFTRVLGLDAYMAMGAVPDVVGGSLVPFAPAPCKVEHP